MKDDKANERLVLDVYDSSTARLQFTVEQREGRLNAIESYLLFPPNCNVQVTQLRTRQANNQNNVAAIAVSWASRVKTIDWTLKTKEEMLSAAKLST